MAAAKVKKTYTAAEVAALENTIQTQQGQIEAQQAQIEELKRKLDHMNEVFANAQRARLVSPARRQPMFSAQTR